MLHGRENCTLAPAELYAAVLVECEYRETNTRTQCTGELRVGGRKDKLGSALKLSVNERWADVKMINLTELLEAAYGTQAIVQINNIYLTIIEMSTKKFAIEKFEPSMMNCATKCVAKGTIRINVCPRQNPII